MLNSLHALSHKSFSEENDPLKNQILTILKCLKNLKISPLLKTTRLVFQLSSNPLSSLQHHEVMTQCLRGT